MRDMGTDPGNRCPNRSALHAVCGVGFPPLGHRFLRCRSVAGPLLKAHTGRMRTVFLMVACVAIGCGGNVGDRSVGTSRPDVPHGGWTGVVETAAAGVATAGAGGDTGTSTSPGGSAGNRLENLSGSAGAKELHPPMSGASGSTPVSSGGNGGGAASGPEHGGAAGSASSITDGGAAGSPPEPLAGSAGLQFGSAGNPTAGNSSEHNGGAAGSFSTIVCAPTFELVDGRCVCPVGTRKKYEECVSHCEYIGCDGDQFLHEMEPGETLWLSWTHQGCHEIVGFAPDGPGVVFAWYGDATQFKVSGLEQQDFPRLWYPTSAVDHGFCISLGSPANVVVTNDYEECGPAPDMQYCCGESCQPRPSPQ